MRIISSRRKAAASRPPMQVTPESALPNLGGVDGFAVQDRTDVGESGPLFAAL